MCFSNRVQHYLGGAINKTVAYHESACDALCNCRTGKSDKNHLVKELVIESRQKVILLPGLLSCRGPINIAVDLHGLDEDFSVNASVSTAKMSFRENLEAFLAHTEHVRNLLARGEDGYQQDFMVRRDTKLISMHKLIIYVYF